MTSKSHTGDTLFHQFKKELSNPIAMVLKAAEGVSVHEFDALLKTSMLHKNQLAAFLGLTTKTIDNYHLKNKRLGRVESEHLLMLISLYKKGQEIFGSSVSFNKWLLVPALGLGGYEAINLLYTPGGINLVMEELLRIEFGALA